MKIQKIYFLALTLALSLSTSKCSHWIHNGNYRYPENTTLNMGISMTNPQLPLDNKDNFIFRGLWIDVRDFLPRGYVTDGSIDYSKQFQKAINSLKNSGELRIPVGV